MYISYTDILSVMPLLNLKSLQGLQVFRIFAFPRICFVNFEAH